MTHIRTIVDHTVYLGQGGIGDTLVITSIGGVEPTAVGAAAIVSDVVGGKIVNNGQAIGADGGGTRGGGIGVDLQAAGKLVNHANIAGGYGGENYRDGGVGVNLQAGGAISNTGSIVGGRAGYSGAGGIAFGGNGVDLLNGGSLVNHGSIGGGSGGFYSYYFNTGGGGAGVYLRAGGSVSNGGTITGGFGGGNYTLYGYNPSTNAGGVGVNLADGGTLRNAGTIVGGGGGYARGAGGAAGAGVLLTNAACSNAGTIAGGHGGGVYNGRGGVGGAGVVLTESSFTNNGTITGGNGGDSYNESGGNGGAGVAMTGGSLVNNGTITGGTGGGGYGNTYGGAGVTINGGTVTNSGTINGGAGGSNRPPGYAVQFGSVAGTLVLVPGSALNGLVVGDGSNDTLVLAAGAHAGTLDGVGTTITGITTIDDAARASWTLTGDVALEAGTTLSVSGALTFGGSAGGPGTAVIDAAGTLTADGALGVGGVQFATGGGTESLILGNPTSVTTTLSGFGTGDTIDLIKLLANGEKFSHGILRLTEGGSVVATLALAGNYSSNNFTLTSDGNGGTTIGFVAGEAPAQTPHDFGWHDAAVAQADSFGTLAWGGGHVPAAQDWMAPLHLPAHVGGW